MRNVSRSGSVSTNSKEEMFENYARDLDRVLPEVFAVVKETARRFKGERHH